MVSHDRAQMSHCVLKSPEHMVMALITSGPFSGCWVKPGKAQRTPKNKHQHN